MDKVIIVASGPSAHELKKEYNAYEFMGIRAHIIAVNGASEFLEGAFDSFFTLDPSPENIGRMSKYSSHDRYCAVDENVMVDIPEGVKTLERVSSDIVDVRPRHTPYWWFRRWGCVRGLSEDPTKIHTGNSAYGALGLAYHWRPKKILLLGLDGTTENRVTDDGPTRYNISHLPYLFTTAVPQLRKAGIKIVNGSSNSQVKCFTRTSVADGLEWINDKV